MRTVVCFLRYASSDLRAVVVDAGYKTPYISKWLIDANIRPVMPYTRPHTKDGFLSKHEYVYDEYYDCYICPQCHTP
jgi:hypothetical protein